MNNSSNLEIKINDAPSSLRRKIKHYHQVAKELESVLEKHPQEWGRFQNQFNAEINGIYREIMNFEKENLNNGNEEKVYRLKKLFVNKLRKYFLRGEFVTKSYEKPFGYAGDFKIIDDIYSNNPSTVGFNRLYDNYFQMAAISVAVRNRKEDFKRLIENFVRQRNGANINIMDIASGPCRDVKEMLCENENGLYKNVNFHCFDADDHAIEYAKKILRNSSQVKFTKMNVLKIALKKDIENAFDTKYDLIYSTGLFDYLDDRVTVRLISNLKKILKPQGILAISDVRDKFSNPSIYFMEWVADWCLIYREDDEFRRLFVQAGYKENDLTCYYEQQGIMQYIITK